MIACPSCGFEAPDDFAFCPKCATVLAAPLAVPEERKVVTTLFCDLVGSTAMGEDADPEDVDVLLRRYNALARQVVESYGGVVEKFIGDAVVAVFGVPAVHEDDPERAVRAGLKLVAMVEELPPVAGHPTKVRVGINTGEALVRLDVTPGSGEGFLTGDAVNVGARLQSAAPPMCVVVGETTHAQTAKAIVYEALGPVAAKGKREPLEAWLALEPVSRTGAQSLDGASPFVGRTVELSYLMALLDKAADSSSPQVALVVGEPGIGKSRLIQELFARVDAGSRLVTWRQGRCLPYGEGVTFWALSQIVKAHAGILETDDLETVEARLEEVLPGGEDRPWFRQRLRALLGLEAAKAEREENFAAWLRFLEGLASHNPTVLIIEDLHWADEALLDFLEFFALRVTHVPLVIVVTARPELFERHPSFAAVVHINRIALEPLSEGETEQLVASVLNEWGTDLPASIAARAQGNPFFAEESARLISERAEGQPASTLSGTVQAVIAARLDSLGAEVKAALSDAAVAGDVFWSGLLVTVGERSEKDVREALDELTAKRLVHRSRTSSMAGEGEYAFAHALVREVAYGQLARRSRASRHGAVAAWIEQKMGDRAEEIAEVIVGHYEAAYSAAVAMGDDEQAARLRTNLVRALLRAAKRAEYVDLVAFRRASTRGLELAELASVEHARFLRHRAQLLIIENRYREAAEVLQNVIPKLLEEGDKRSAALAMSALAAAYSFMGKPGFDLWAKAVQLLEEDGPSKELVILLSSFAGAASMREGGTPEEVIEIAQRALDLNDALGLSLSAAPLGWRGAARLDAGDLGGLEDYHRALEEAKKQGLPEETALILFNSSTAEFALNGAARALELQLEGLELSKHHGIDYFVLASRALLVETYANLGEWQRAMQHAAEVIPDLEHAHDVIDLVLVRSHLLLLLTRTGRVGEAGPWMDWLEESGCGTETMFLKIYAMLALVEARWAMGQEDQAVAILSKWSTLPAVPSEPATAMFVPGAIRTSLTCHQVDSAERLVVTMEPNLPLREYVRSGGDACLTLARGDHHAALASFEHAAMGWRELGVPYEEAQALLGQGRCLLALDRASEAEVRLTSARAIFARLGAKPALAEADDWLSRVGAP